MHTMRLLEKWLQRNAIIGHQARVGALVRVVGALLSGGQLALTHIGRQRAGRAFVRHPIKAVDRLLGKRHLNRERDGVYRALARTVLGGVARPVILVDWADSALAHKQFILKAAVPVKGRAISVYEEVHPMRCYNNARTHRRFLHRLQSILPEVCLRIPDEADHGIRRKPITHSDSSRSLNPVEPYHRFRSQADHFSAATGIVPVVRCEGTRGAG